MNKWDQRYLDKARHISTWSKDPSTKVGSTIVAPRGIPVSEGYNGFPRGIHDTPERLNDRDQKYEYVVHAEKNAIYNAAWNGTTPYQGTMYVYGLPVCSECAKGVIQVGINRVVMQHPRDIPEVWNDRWAITRRMFVEVGIWYDRYDETGELIESYRSNRN